MIAELRKALRRAVFHAVITTAVAAGVLLGLRVHPPMAYLDITTHGRTAP